VLGVAGFNIWSLYITRPADASLAAKLLSYHSTANPKYYAYNSSVKTVVVGTEGFAPEAFAQSPPPSTDTVGDQTSSDVIDENDFIVHDAIVRPNPDSIKTLIAKQFQVHTVTSGETLLSIALKYHLNRSTLQWANKLPDYTVKPGWNILIPPIDGVTVTATSNDTIPDLAKRYHGTIETIVSYNGLENEEDIAAGQIIIIPDGYIAAPPAPKAKPKTSPGDFVPDEAGSTHLFPRGYCTYYVARKMKITFGGDAKYWLSNAQGAGYETGSKPVVGASPPRRGRRAREASRCRTSAEIRRAAAIAGDA
jgi:LysM repeat protein